MLLKFPLFSMCLSQIFCKCSSRQVICLLAVFLNSQVLFQIGQFPFSFPGELILAICSSLNHHFAGLEYSSLLWAFLLCWIFCYLDTTFLFLLIYSGSMCFRMLRRKSFWVFVSVEIFILFHLRVFAYTQGPGSRIWPSMEF